MPSRSITIDEVEISTDDFDLEDLCLVLIDACVRDSVSGHQASTEETRTAQLLAFRDTMRLMSDKGARARERSLKLVQQLNEVTLRRAQHQLACEHIVPPWCLRPLTIFVQ